MVLLLKSNSLDKKRNKNKARNGQPVRSKSSVRKSYENKLLNLDKQQAQSINSLISLIESGASATVVSNFLVQQQEQASLLYQQSAFSIASQFTADSSKTNKDAMTTSIKNSLNLDYAEIIDNEEVEKSLASAIIENVSLIRSIPAEKYSKVAQAVTQNFKGDMTDDALIKRLQDIENITTNRAKFIAKDQTAKLNGSLNQVRSKNIGINSFVWRTAKNEKVVGTPGGLYPKATDPKVHGNHYVREGKIFYYDKPPQDGVPGQPINCNCYAEPRIVLDNLNVQYI